MRICAIGLLLVLGGRTAQADSPIQPGDRIAIVGNTFADQLRMHGYLETLLLQHSQVNPVSIRNLGWGGDMLRFRDRPTGFPTEEATLTGHQTDVMIACFGMGESFAGERGLDDFRNDLRAFIKSHTEKTYNGKTKVRLILVSPIAYEELGQLTPDREKRTRELESYTRVMNEVADAAGIPFVDLYHPSKYLMEEPQGPQLTTNGIHLNSYGYWAISQILYSHLVTQERSAGQQPWRLWIDAKTCSGEARGVEIAQLVADGAGLRFAAREVSGPTPPPPLGPDQTLPVQLSDQRDTLTVVNLQPGTYALRVDGETVVTASDETWTKGVAIDSSPAHKAAEALREAVNDKNLQFTYSWKALNQVHIVGERRASPSGQALPDELIAFNRLTEAREAALHSRMELKTRQWRLVPSILQTPIRPNTECK